ncbi:flagellar basal body-associated protein FliL [Shewanella sp. WXL01]|uniref:Flagellar protein FliL n=1 Tax=Shewanella maritima TaxID=2520507 RepID=A0A411PE22_9GAMM|nr:MULTISPECIES: flagellar basal body-associated protein FliL [Shewanella]NKF50142.1 flagellar basal body-associated protein FliL [Shewanella sp. WXL01]QBF81809.1 flagellar basal body-associated protein FliL [Shewanella maritima]
MAEQELELEENGGEGKKSKKMLFIIIGVVLLLAIGGGAFFFLSGDDAANEQADSETVPGEVATTAEPTGKANYVGMPRPFLFNLPGATRSRLVEIKVQLMVRGDDDVLTRKHIPLIEDALLTTFSAADVQKLSSQAGKDELRQLALLNVQNTLQAVTGRKVVEKVLFTGFVMQ